MRCRSTFVALLLVSCARPTRPTSLDGPSVGSPGDVPSLAAPKAAEAHPSPATPAGSGAGPGDGTGAAAGASGAAWASGASPSAAGEGALASQGRGAHLEFPQALDAFFRALRELDSTREDHQVRIVQWGDSHTAGDYFTAAVRTRLVTRFGDGGRGFVPLGPPFKRLYQKGEEKGDGKEVTPVEPKAWESKGLPVPPLGPWGIAMDAPKGLPKLESIFTANAEHYKLLFWKEPRGGSFEVWIDHARRTTVATQEETAGVGVHDEKVTPGRHTVELKGSGQGPLRFFGVDLALEHPRGITLDTLGINGAKARDFLSQSDSFFADAQRLLAPKLVVFAFGTNESGDSHAVDDHRQAIEALVTKMRGAMPKAACLLLGPMDRAGAGRGPESTLPKIPLIDEAQRQAAQRLGCAYYSQFRAMGGAGSMAIWSSEPIPRRARTDRVHLTERGYVLLGNGFAEGLLHGFEQWNASPK